MRITGLHIDGFGRFHDQSFSGLNGSLVVLHGDNEAGKSTLLGFIRTIFFGFPRANAKNEIPYPPAPGGVHGGQIDITAANGDEYTVTRSPGPHGGTVTVDGPRGITGRSGLLSRLLGGVTQDVFRNIFAFGLSELQTLDTLQEEGVKSAVYGAGIGTGALALPRAKKRLQGHVEALFKPGGSKPLVNAKLAELEAAEKALRDAGRQISRYDAAVTAWEAAGARMADLSEALERRRRDQHRYGAYARLWPEWLSYLENEAALSALGPVPAAFPEAGLDRLEKETNACRGYVAEITDLSDRKTRLQAQADRLVVDTALLDLAHAVTGLNQEKRAYTEKCDGLPGLVREKNALETDIRHRLETLGRGWGEAEILHIDRSVFTREEIRRHQAQLQHRSGALAAAAEICADCGARYEQAAQAVRPAKNALVGLGKPAPEPDPPALLKLKQGRDRFAEAIHAAAGLSHRRARLRRDLDRTLRDIDPDWREADLDRFDASLAARRQVEAFSDRMAGTRETVRMAETGVRDRAAALALSREYLETLGNEPVPPDPWTRWPAAVMGVTAAWGSAGWCWMADALPWAISVTALPVAYLVFLLKKHRAARDLRKRRHTAMANRRDQVARSEAALVAAQKDLAREKQRLARTTSDWREYLKHLGLGTAVTPRVAMDLFFKVETARQQQQAISDLVDRDRQLFRVCRAYGETARALPALAAAQGSGPDLLQAVDRYIARLPEQEKHRETVSRAQEELARCIAREAAARAALETAREDRDARRAEYTETETGWHQWLRSHGLPPGLSPETALEALDTIHAIRAAITQRDRQAAEIHRVETDLSAYRAAARSILEGLGRRVPSETAEWPAAMDELMAGLEESRGNQREKAALASRIDDMARRLSALRRRQAKAQENIRALLAEAGTDLEADFRQKGRAHAERRRLTDALAGNEKNMRRITGEFEVAALKARLRALSLSQITEREKAAAAAASDLARELEEIRDRRARLNQEIDALSSDEDVAGLREEVERLRAELQARAFDWSRYALAGYLMDRAGKSFEKEHQPRVIRDAGRFFKNITGGRYTRLVSPLGEKTVQAVTADKRRVGPETLSRGTAEQLYLAVRFGYIRHRAQNSEPLPVVMDDILVNFDPARARATAETICELARTHQVLFFTCHPQTIDRFRDVDASARIVHLEG